MKIEIPSIEPKLFLEKGIDIPIIDVRSPAEFAQAHIPGAVNIPLFENDERAKVGTIYKKQNKDKAVLAGLDIVGPKMANKSKKDCQKQQNTYSLLAWRNA